MLKRKILMMLMVAGFLMVFTEKVEAKCTTILNVKDSNGYVVSGTVAVERETGGSVCNIKGDWIDNLSGGPSFYGVDGVVLQCGADGNFTEIDACGETACKNDSSTSASCHELSGNIDCTTAYGKKISNTENGCMMDTTTVGGIPTSYGICRGGTGQMEYIGTCDEGKFCEDGAFLWADNYSCKKATCYDKNYNITANEGDVRCLGSVIKKCNKGNFDQVETCDGSCVVTASGPTCQGDENNLGDVCVKVKVGGQDIGSINKTVVGESACYNDTIYSCTSESKPYFNESGTDCSASGKVCRKENGQTDAKCMTQEEATENTNLIDNTSNTIDTTGQIANVFCSGSSDIQTALGCVPTEINKFVPWLLSWLFGVAGGIAFLLMSYGFILIATSSGDEKKVQGAKETITSAVIGLLICIFAVFILRLIAVNILKIPGIN